MTGVQTCALPILDLTSGEGSSRRRPAVLTPCTRIGKVLEWIFADGQSFDVHSVLAYRRALSDASLRCRMMSPLASFLAAIMPYAAGDSLSSCRRFTNCSEERALSSAESF